MAGNETLSMVLFSGTDDKLTAAAVLAAGAAMMGRTVDIFLQYWALDAFRADRIRKDHGAVAEAGYEGASLMRELAEQGGTQHWSDTLRQAKELGELHVHACALSMDLFHITMSDLDPLVEDVEGVAAFMLEAGDALVFV